MKTAGSHTKSIEMVELLQYKMRESLFFKKFGLSTGVKRDFRPKTYRIEANE